MVDFLQQLDIYAQIATSRKIKLLMKKDSILYTHPEIVKDWDFENNKNISPADFVRTSHFTVWWNCLNNHAYKVSIYSRIRSAGCKICNAPNRIENIRKSKLLKGKSFAQAKPELLLEWNYNKNEVNPNEISEKSHIKVWFKCINNHEWQTSPNTRSRGCGCPKCFELSDKSKLIREKLLKKQGLTLADEFPDLVKEWDFKKNEEHPEKYSSGSNQKASWKCSFGHSWVATIYNRARNLSGCPSCKASTSKLEVFLLTEMRGLFKDVIWRHKINGYECDIYIPEIQTGIEVDGAFWHDDRLERDNLKIKVFKDNGVRLIRVRDELLPEIEGEVIIYNKKSLDIDLSCEVVKYLLKINSEERLLSYVKNHIQIGDKEYKKILSLLPSPTEDNSLSEINQKLSQEWDYDKNSPLTPLMFTPNSEKKVFWRCKDGHSWEASIKNRHLRNSGCPLCYANNRSEILRRGKLKKSSDTFGSVSPNLLLEWDYKKNKISPFEVAPKSSLKVWWICPESHEYQKTIKGKANGNDCPYCSSKKRSNSARNARILKTGTLDLKYPEIAIQWDFQKNNSKPTEFSPGSNTKVWWLCQNNHSWIANISSRTKQNQGCPICFKQNRNEIFLKSAIKRCGSLEHHAPSFLKEWDFTKNRDIKPSEITLNNKNKIWWICSNYHSFSQSPNDRNNGHGCPICSKQKKIESYKLKILANRGSFEDNNPNLLKYWDFSKNKNVNPCNITSGSREKVWWKCEKGHSWFERIALMTNLKRVKYCRVCNE
jgi:very-short-patch-repair endonuclease